MTIKKKANHIVNERYHYRTNTGKSYFWYAPWLLKDPLCNHVNHESCWKWHPWGSCFSFSRWLMVELKI